MTYTLTYAATECGPSVQARGSLRDCVRVARLVMKGNRQRWEKTLDGWRILEGMASQWLRITKETT